MAGGCNKGLNFDNVVTNSETTGDEYHGGGGGIGINLKCWNCGGDHLKRNFPKYAEEKERKKKG